MEEVTLTEPEVAYYSDLFQRCDEEQTSKIPMLKAVELFRSANITNEVVIEIISLAGIPSAALHISRAQFYSCLKLIAAHQAGMSLRQELIVATVLLPLPRFIWQEEGALPGAMPISVLPPPPPTDRRNSLRRNSQTSQHAEVPSTDSEFDANDPQQVCKLDNISTASSLAGETRISSSSSRELHRRAPEGCGSPEAWSTNSDSPTPTNSVAERPWAKDAIWHTMIGDEHRQLLGTEEESSDRHTSDEDEHDSELASLYQITLEQRDYYEKQFKAVQHDPNGLLSGPAARQFFEKSRIPVEELRHIWQLCDVTRDGALSLAEFTSAMHLVVLRRNNIPLPTRLPACLHPTVLQQFLHVQQEPPEADLLHLNDDDEVDKRNSSRNTLVQSLPNNSEPNIMNISAISKSTISPPTSSIPQQAKKSSISKSSPNGDRVATSPNLPTENATQWTKFTESPAPPPVAQANQTGLKPALFDMKRTAQDVGSNPQILHPVPLRVTPVANALNSMPATNHAVEVAVAQNIDEANPKNVMPTAPPPIAVTQQPLHQNHRDSVIQAGNDLRAIQRPQAKKLPTKNFGALPPPPQREPSIGIADTSSIGSTNNSAEFTNQHYAANKKEPPPLPPPRPHRHTRSSSLDLNKFKTNSGGSQQPETEPNHDLQQQSLPVVHSAQASVSGASPSSRVMLQSAQGVSAFEVYRKPNSARGSQSPIQQQPTQPPPPAPVLPTTSQNPSIPNADVFEKRVAAISETLRHVSFKQSEHTIPDVLRRLREQNSLLLRLCNDLSDELLTVQTRKEEMRTRYESLLTAIASATNNEQQIVQQLVAQQQQQQQPQQPTQSTTRTVSSISAPVTANVTGGSSGSGSGATSHTNA